MAGMDSPTTHFPSPTDAGHSISQKGFKITTRKLPILKAGPIEEMTAKLGIAPPEMIFGDNRVSVTHEQTGWAISFNAFDALDRVDKKGDDMLKVAYSQEWQKNREKVHEGIQEVVKPFDWSYTTDYKGSINAGDTQFEKSSKPIPLELLKRPDPILFFDEVMLYEDELADNGIAMLSCKIRVMPARLLLLCRFFMRLDHVLVRLRDTRVYIDFAAKEVIREYVAKEEQYEVVKQDTPDVKSTFDIRVCSALPVVASGLLERSTQLQAAGNEEGEKRLYSFSQKIPIPSYLFAIASGDIVGAPIGPRSMVWTGPEELEAAKWELERDTETFIKTAEEIVYPYAWTSYNVLVLPPSFPYGGMENPVYTFATPTIISGDRENIDVIAHELSHSWSGNLVTNASWEHFWLNEGWTTYLERRIQAAVHGEAQRDFSAIIGWKALTDSINEFGEDHEFTKLIPSLTDKDPDDSFSSVPYEKGFTLLYTLEKLIGQKKWDKFIPHYFTQYQQKSLDSGEFRKTLQDFFTDDQEASGAMANVDWHSWFYKPGFPPKPDFDTSLVDVCYHLADKWEQKAHNEKSQAFIPKSTDITGWTANQLVVFLERIQLFENALPPSDSTLMGTVYGFAESKNVEVVSRYYEVGLRAKDSSVYEPTARLLGQVGRMKFVRPLYRQLNAVDRALALSTFEKNKDFYHPICRAMVEKDLFGKQGGTP
ncbi:MAG: hypothetical protein M1817_001282 [Caeruleum heppii]|nr:MAG: hypothetical protein M1817_001282 [Caeruleum heppii]